MHRFLGAYSSPRIDRYLDHGRIVDAPRDLSAEYAATGAKAPIAIGCYRDGALSSCLSYAKSLQVRSWLRNGVARMRLPVA
jgi:hypothetical protein